MKGGAGAGGYSNLSKDLRIQDEREKAAVLRGESVSPEELYRQEQKAEIQRLVEHERQRGAPERARRELMSPEELEKQRHDADVQFAERVAAAAAKKVSIHAALEKVSISAAPSGSNKEEEEKDKSVKKTKEEFKVYIQEFWPQHADIADIIVNTYIGAPGRPAFLMNIPKTHKDEVMKLSAHLFSVNGFQKKYDISKK